ncbi:MAG TPA: hypothetical protein VNN73_14370 [Blastocatellia bacterium]|nr:hypothetical protein [Blastocatellia bacterium]
MAHAGDILSIAHGVVPLIELETIAASKTMDLNDATQNIIRFTRQVMWRKRLLALQNYLAIAAFVGGILVAALVLYGRLRPVYVSSRIIIAAVLGAALLIALIVWRIKHADERDAAFVIDSTLELEDRITTSEAILERGGPRHDFERALIEDAASRISNQQASSIVPYRASKLLALSVVGAVALAVALMIPERALPGGAELAQERADVQSAGELLEQNAVEIEQAVAPESETARLAKEQVELGRALRTSPESRAEALKKLSALEQRIRRRHDELASTRADEIVSLAEQRLSVALAPKPANRRSEVESSGEPLSEEAAASSDFQSSAHEKSSRRSARTDRKKSSASIERNTQASNPQAASQSQNRSESAAANQARAQTKGQQSQPQNRLQEPVSGQQQPATSRSNQGGDANQQATEQNAQREAQSEQQGGEKNQQVPNGLTGMMAEQAAKALPQMSEALMQKAAELRAGQLSAEDIRALQQAAEFLARDLSKLAESKEFQAAVEQLAQQVTPEQIEQVARELMKNEQLKRELEATARMLMQNQQAKQMVAGLAQQLAEIRDKMRGKQDSESISEGDSRGGKNRGGREGTNSRDQPEPSESGRLTEQGKEIRIDGKLQRKNGGEYLYLQTKPSEGAARAPYSSAYPQYRREAERSVQRSQIPPHMRSVVRRYFDAINPDAQRKP